MKSSPPPAAERRCVLPGGVDRRELLGTGLCPRDFAVLDGRPRTRPLLVDKAQQKGFHPDDAHREEHYRDHRDER